MRLVLKDFRSKKWKEIFVQILHKPKIKNLKLWSLSLKLEAGWYASPIKNFVGLEAVSQTPDSKKN